MIAQVIPMHKDPRHQDVLPETYREREDERRAREYGVVSSPSGPISRQIIHMPLRAGRKPLSQQIACNDALQVLIGKYTLAAVVRSLATELAAEGYDISALTIDDLAAGDEQQ